MDHVIRIRNTGFVACKSCHYAILPSQINTHFKKSQHPLDQDTRNRLFEEVRQWPNLILDSSQIQSHIDTLPKNPPYFPELSLYQDGMGCSEHSYIAKNRISIQHHFRDSHRWVNSRPKGRRAKKDDEVL